MEFLRHRRAADNAAALEHGHLHARAREIERAHEAVMAAADDDDVGSVHATLYFTHQSRPLSTTLIS